MTNVTRSEALIADISALLRARTPLLWVVTREEARVEASLFEAAGLAGYIPRTWDAGLGVADLTGNPITNMGSTDIGDTLATIRARAQSTTSDRGAWILRDLHSWLVGPIGLVTVRQVRNLARLLPTIQRDNAQAIIVITPESQVPLELTGHATVVNWPLPDRTEIAAILDSTIESLPDEIRRTAIANGTRDAAIDAALGLTQEEATSCFTRSLIQFRRIDPATVANEKKRVIAREKVLEWYDSLPGGLDSVGGLENLKRWLRQRAIAYTPAARSYGLPAPRGCLIVGVSGCGKSLTAKAITTAWGIPLLKLDLAALKGKFVGESEGNLRRAIAVIEAVGRCVVWVDEIEKALAGATSGSSDGGVSMDQVGALLTWMQERKGESFIMATANDVSSLPPELLRKGRFDEVWWVDLPTFDERREILNATLNTYSRDNATITSGDLDTVAYETDGFTGAEIAALVPEAMFEAFADNARELTTEDLLIAARSVVPLSKTASEKIEKLRAWASGRARPATLAAASPSPATIQSRRIDL